MAHHGSAVPSRHYLREKRNCENKNIQQNEWGVIKTTAIQEMLFLESENNVLPKNFKILENYVIKNYDLLITRAGPINRVGIVCQVKDLKSQLINANKKVKALKACVGNRDLYEGAKLEPVPGSER